MSQAGLLLLLWDALQHRQTTFGQVLDLSAACGLDGRQVLIEHLNSHPGHWWPVRDGNARISGNQTASRSEQPCTISPPGESSGDRLARPTGIELLKQGAPFLAVNPDKELGHPSPRQPALHIKSGAINEFFIMAAMVNLVVCPLPKLGAALPHFQFFSSKCLRKARDLLTAYMPTLALSKAFRLQYSFNDSEKRIFTLTARLKPLRSARSSGGSGTQNLTHQVE